MNKRKKLTKADWKFWWEQVENGFIPETTYMFAQVKEKYMKLKEEHTILKNKYNKLKRNTK